MIGSARRTGSAKKRLRGIVKEKHKGKVARNLEVSFLGWWDAGGLLIRTALGVGCLQHAPATATTAKAYPNHRGSNGRGGRRHGRRE